MHWSGWSHENWLSKPQAPMILFTIMLAQRSLFATGGQPNDTFRARPGIITPGKNIATMLRGQEKPF